MLLSQFEGRFPTEESCVSYFRDIRISQGVSCPNCGDKTDKWLQGRKAFQCMKCGCGIPLTKGTVMEHSKLSLRTWFYAMHLMTSIKQVLSAKEVQHQLRIEQYPPVWLMMMELRNIMGKRDSIYQLSDKVELDEAFFPTRFLKRHAARRLNAVQEASNKPKCLSSLKASLSTRCCSNTCPRQRSNPWGRRPNWLKRRKGKASERLSIT